MSVVVDATPRPLYPRERPGTHIIGDWVGRRVGLRKISPLPGFNLRTVEPVASRYSDYTIPAHIPLVRVTLILIKIFTVTTFR